MVTVLMQVVGQVCQVATATPVVSPTVEASGTGGLLQSPVPPLGDAYWSTNPPMSSDTPAVEASANLLVASGIKNLKL
jgi:hypothetical protein